MGTILTHDGTFTARVDSWGEGETAKGAKTFNIEFEILDPPYTGFTQRYTGFLGDEKKEEYVCKALEACGWSKGKDLECIKNAVVSVVIKSRTTNGRTFYNVQYVNAAATGGGGKKTTMSAAAKQDFLGRMGAAKDRIVVAETSTETDPFA